MKNFGPSDSKVIMDDPKESVLDTSIAMSNHIQRFEDFDLESQKDKQDQNNKSKTINKSKEFANKSNNKLKLNNKDYQSSLNSSE